MVIPKSFLLFALVLLTTSNSVGQELFSIVNASKQRVLLTEPTKIYDSSCTVLRQEFGRSVQPKVILVLGAEKNTVSANSREIRLVKWDRYLFAQGVIYLGVTDLMGLPQIETFTKRALARVDATVSLQELRQ